MKKIICIAIVVVALIVAGCVCIFSHKNKTDVVTPTVTPEVTAVADIEEESSPNVG